MTNYIINSTTIQSLSMVNLYRTNKYERHIIWASFAVT